MIVEAARHAIFSEAELYFSNPTELATFRQSFDVRLEVERAIANGSRSPKRDRVGWKVSQGYYPGLLAKYETIDRGRRKINSPIRGIERVIDAQIRSLIGRRSDTSPVIVFDFGGGSGISMIRIAAQNREAIERGQLVFGVSNLGYIPSTEPDNNGYTRVAKELFADKDFHYSTEELGHIQQNQELVGFVDAIAEELPGITIEPPVGNTAKFNNVDIIHEQDAIMHTQIPDLALFVLAKALSDQGTFFLKSTYMHGPSGSKFLVGGRTMNLWDIGYRQPREDSLKVGISLVKNMGYKLGYLQEDPGYYPPVYFAGSNALDINLIIGLGKESP